MRVARCEKWYVALRSWLAAVLLVLTGAVVPSCNIVGPAVVFLSPPPSNKAVVELDDKLTHVFFIDDLRSRVPKRSLREHMAESAEGAVLEEKALTPEKLLSAKAVQRAIASDRHGEALSIVDVGKRAGADVVIYVTIDGWGLSKDGVTAAPFVNARVKLLDCAANKRVWPNNEEGYRLNLAPSMQQGAMPLGLSERGKMEETLAKQFGLALGQMFYKHYQEDSARK